MTADAEQQLSPGASFGQFRIEGLLGAGGMGQVYRATDMRLHRTVAIKVLPPELSNDPDFGAQLEREARVLASLSHPNIAAIHGLEESSRIKGLVLEFIEGPTLAEMLSGTQHRLPTSDALAIATQIALALEAAHEKGIVHRDLKPANIKIAPNGVVKVLDFGIAKFVDPIVGRSGWWAADATRTGLILGTPAYMSPEQARGLAVDKRTDIWAFGCVLFECLGGRGAFTGETASDSLARVLEREPDWSALPSDVPQAIRRLLDRCLQKNPGNRLHDIADARLEIAEALSARAPRRDSGQAGTSPTLALEVTRRFLPDVRARLAVGVALAAVIIAGLYFWSRRPVMPAASGRTSVVALPAQVFGAQELGYLTDAIPSTLSTQLGQVQGLETKVPPTSIEFETIRRNLGTVADLYGVTRCIVSSITATDQDHFVLNVQVVEPRSGEIKWGQRYEGRRGSYLELARQAADGIRQHLVPAASSVTAAVGATANSEAELALREGIYFFNRYNNRHEPGHFDLAYAALQRAITLDPRLADAVGLMAMLHRLKWEASAMSTEEAIPEIERWANQALAITPRCSRAWSALFWAEIMRPSPNWRKLLDYGLKAVSYGPQDSLAHTTLGATLLRSSNELALQAFLESRGLDPLYLYASLNAANSLTRLGRPTEALTLADEALRVEPSLPYGVNVKSLSLLRLGRRHDYVEWIQQHPKVFEGRPVPAYVLAVERGETEKADAALKSAVTRVTSAQTSSNERSELARALVPLLIEQGKKDLALELLSRTADLGDVPPYDWLMSEPQFAVVRNDGRFKATEARSRARFEELRAMLGEARARGEMPAYLDAPLARLVSALSIAK